MTDEKEPNTTSSKPRARAKPADTSLHGADYEALLRRRLGRPLSGAERDLIRLGYELSDGEWARPTGKPANLPEWFMRLYSALAAWGWEGPGEPIESAAARLVAAMDDRDLVLMPRSIAMAEAPAAGPWIAVTERMPEERARVLLLDGGDEAVTGLWNGDWYRDDLESWQGAAHPTHWAELRPPTKAAP